MHNMIKVKGQSHIKMLFIHHIFQILVVENWFHPVQPYHQPWEKYGHNLPGQSSGHREKNFKNFPSFNIYVEDASF